VCLLAAAKADPKAASVWVNLANAYYMADEHKNSKRCLEQVTNVLISFIGQICCHGIVSIVIFHQMLEKFLRRYIMIMSAF
jgi:hypothetical protein